MLQTWSFYDCGIDWRIFLLPRVVPPCCLVKTLWGLFKSSTFSNNIRTRIHKKIPFITKGKFQEKHKTLLRDWSISLISLTANFDSGFFVKTGPGQSSKSQYICACVECDSSGKLQLVPETPTTWGRRTRSCSSHCLPDSVWRVLQDVTIHILHSRRSQNPPMTAIKTKAG